MNKTITAKGDNGYLFAIDVIERTQYAESCELRIEFQFRICWASGSIKFFSSTKRFEAFTQSIINWNNGEMNSFDYLSDEGNLEIKVMQQTTGSPLITVLAIPSMNKDDRIEFEFYGILSVAALAFF